MRKLASIFILSSCAFAQLTVTSNGIPGQALTISAGQIAASAGGTGVNNTATLTLGTSNINLATIGTGIVKVTTTTGAVTDAAAADVYGLWSGTCSSSTFLRGDGSCAAPSGSGTVNSGTANQLAYYSATGTAVSGLTSANNGILITSGSGVPSISSTLPTAVQGNITGLGTITSGVWNGTALTSAYLPATPNCTANVVTFSATPTFNLALGCPEITLTGNITSFSVSNMAAGMVFDIHVCQNATGGYSMSSPPASLHNFMAIGTTASKCSDQWYRADNTGSAAFPISALVNN